MILVEYKNGNYLVKLYKDGTKERLSDTTELIPDYPESLDIKITNFCDAGCSYCHEKSTVLGKHANPEVIFRTLKDLPRGTELAIGGGDPMSHPNLEDILVSFKETGFLSNITVNEYHIEKYISQLEEYQSKGLITAVGISVTKDIEKCLEFYLRLKNSVLHIIIGCHSPAILKNVKNARILLLGYKNFGRGLRYKEKYTEVVEKNIKDWYRSLGKLLRSNLICFDNLALEQLNPKRLFLDEEQYSKKFMGKDGKFSMYIDFVREEYSQASFLDNRLKIRDLSLKQFFNITKGGQYEE